MVSTCTAWRSCQWNGGTRSGSEITSSQNLWVNPAKACKKKDTQRAKPPAGARSNQFVAATNLRNGAGQPLEPIMFEILRLILPYRIEKQRTRAKAWPRSIAGTQ